MPDHQLQLGRAAGLVVLLLIVKRTFSAASVLRSWFYRLLLLQSGAIGMLLLGPQRLAYAIAAAGLRTATAAFLVCRLALHPFVAVRPTSHLVPPLAAAKQDIPGLSQQQRIDLPLRKLQVRECRTLPAGSSFSFCGCSWMLFYHLGVASAIQQQLVRPAEVSFCGASCGSLVAAALAIDVPMDRVLAFGLELHAASDSRLAGPMGDMSRIVRTGLEGLLPIDAHEQMNRLTAAGGKLVVSLSVWEPPMALRNVLDQRETFCSRDELIDLLLASCYIPLYYEDMQWYGQKLVFDGGATDNMPVIDKHTVTVSPKCAAAVISPRTRVFPDCISIMPGSQQDCLELFEQGRTDADLFITESIDTFGQVSRQIP